MTPTILPKSRSLIWWFAPNYGTTIGSTILMPDRWYTLAEPERQAWLEHELCHVRNGVNWLRYLTSRQYRRECEMEAYRCQVQYLLAHGRAPRVEEWARVMAGYGIWSWITEQEARERLREWIG